MNNNVKIERRNAFMEGVIEMSMLGERLTDLREERGWSKTYTAGKLGVKAMSTYANWEYGNREPDAQMLSKMADLFEVTVDYLVGRSDIKNPEEITYAGIKNDEYAALTPYQKEVMDFFMNSESLSFHDKPENLLDALEEFEIFYEMLKKREERKK